MANSKETYSITFPNGPDVSTPKRYCEIYSVLGRCRMRLSKKQILEQIKNDRKKFSSELGVEFKKTYVENTLSGYISTFNSFCQKTIPHCALYQTKKESINWKR